MSELNIQIREAVPGDAATLLAIYEPYVRETAITFEYEVPEVEDEYLTRVSVHFHKHLGFRMVGEFYKCGFKFGRWYNMAWMEKHIGEHGAQPKVTWKGEM